MVEFAFKSNEARKVYESKLAILEEVNNDIHLDTAYLWDKTVEKYVSKMLKVKKILQEEEINNLVTTNMFKQINTFLNKCSSAEFHIALVGTIKAGKSTLINALLDYEYASTNVTPETASLTKFRKGTTNYIKVSFYTKQEWVELWKSVNDTRATVFLEEYETLNAESEKDHWVGQTSRKILCETKEKLIEEIQKWTSSKSACHYFVKEVEVGLEEFELPEGVILVDTPGLDDVVEYRSNITRDYIDRANAVLVCVKSDTLTGPELATIYSVFSNTRYNPEKVYIIATQVDTLNKPREDWKKQQKEWIKYLKTKQAYANEYLAEKNLISVSAYLFTLLKSYKNLSEDDEKCWELKSTCFKLRINNIEEKYQELLDFTNITFLKNKIQREIVQSYKKILVEDIKGSYIQCKNSIKETMNNIKIKQEEIISMSQTDIKDLKIKQREYEEKYKEMMKEQEDRRDTINILKIKVSQFAEEIEEGITKETEIKCV